MAIITIIAFIMLLIPVVGLVKFQRRRKSYELRAQKNERFATAGNQLELQPIDGFDSIRLSLSVAAEVHSRQCQEVNKALADLEESLSCLINRYVRVRKAREMGQYDSKSVLTGILLTVDGLRLTLRTSNGYSDRQVRITAKTAVYELLQLIPTEEEAEHPGLSELISAYFDAVVERDKAGLALAYARKAADSFGGELKDRYVQITNVIRHQEHHNGYGRTRFVSEPLSLISGRVEYCATNGDIGLFRRGSSYSGERVMFMLRGLDFQEYTLECTANTTLLEVTRIWRPPASLARQLAL